MNEKDEKMLPVLQLFNRFDLYSKHDDLHDLDAIKPYYSKLMRKYFANDYLWV